MRAIPSVCGWAMRDAGLQGHYNYRSTIQLRRPTSETLRLRVKSFEQCSSPGYKVRLPSVIVRNISVPDSWWSCLCCHSKWRSEFAKSAWSGRTQPHIDSHHHQLTPSSDLMISSMTPVECEVFSMAPGTTTGINQFALQRGGGLYGTYNQWGGIQPCRPSAWEVRTSPTWPIGAQTHMVSGHCCI